MATDLEIIYNLGKNLKFSIIRATNHGFLYMNAEALKMFGFECLEEATAYPRRMMFADSDTYLHLLTKHKAYGILSDERVLFNRKDQSNFWGSLTSRLYEVNGEMFYDEIIVDVSDDVINEHTLFEKSHLLEKVANELDRFIYSASHDLRSPISTMKGLMSLLQMNLGGISFDQFLGMMEECLDKLETFINKLVEFSKNSNEPVLIGRLDVDKIIKSILDDLKEHPQSAKVKVQCIIPIDSHICSDFNKIHSALFHIIKNSFDYLDSSKPRSLLSIKAIVSKDKAIIEVVDNGVGIDRKYIPTIFQMFYRASSLSKGSGLGLYLAREAIVKLGGSIEIRSEINLGTFVTLQIPMNQTQPDE